ncbi:MAG: bifunctional diaminohydroxyphosphoribosylaminopyrimidine deaminase/5-amino-6-(5-phosphoribosylamino)uracil reductase RibD [Flavobacteriales bacterium]
MHVHNHYMKRSLALASNGLGHTLSNPLVGCVIVNAGKIIGEAYHKKFGGPHAEVLAWENAGKPESLKDCTVYVNMEPCTHYGKTPPCTDLLEQLLPKTVVVAQTDPNTSVSGKGIEVLRNAGIEVITGVLEKEARFINRRFNTYHEKKRPYIILKWAQTSDGFVGPATQKEGERFVISNPFMHTMVHTWRAQEMSISVGKGTVLQDDPELTVRLVEGKNPVRIILDRDLEIPLIKKVFNTNAPTLVFNCSKDDKKENVEWIKISRENFSSHALEAIWKRGIVSVFIEGGPNMINTLLAAGVWDEIRTITSPITLTNGINAPTAKGKLIISEEVNGDRLEIRMNEL